VVVKLLIVHCNNTCNQINLQIHQVQQQDFYLKSCVSLNQYDKLHTGRGQYVPASINYSVSQMSQRNRY